MSALKLCGIEVDAIVAVSSDVEGQTRDIGAMDEAADGSMYVTRSARKQDLTFSTVPLSLADALAWWSFFTGEGETWSFDSSLYGSKGTGPSGTTGTAVQSAGSAKYGAGKLSLSASSSITWDDATRNSFGRLAVWTVSVWRNAGSWTHYVVNSSGQKWVDGVRNDAATTTFLSVSAGDVTLSNSSGTVTFDDLVVSPYLWPLDWPSQVHAAAAAFGPLPSLAATGDFVDEQTSRAVVGKVEKGKFMKVGGGVVMRTLDVELAAR